MDKYNRFQYFWSFVDSCKGKRILTIIGYKIVYYIMKEIALSLSGGGYRAAMFHLGTLAYLNRIKLSNGKRLLEVVNTISTISGGSITGLWYMMHVCKGENIDKCFKELFHKFSDVDLPQSVLNSFLDEKNTNDSLIRETIHFYDDVFFKGQTFGLLMNGAEHSHIHHFSANGTDFSNGIAFRFQASRAIQNALPEFRYGFIGNNKHKIPRNLAAKIKLSEILAVSSCFPGGFEPVVFPNDFELYREKANQEILQNIKPFELMDGGIVDNQGIEPLLLANQQMSYDNSLANGNKNYPCHDLIIVSDVASPDINPNRKIKFPLFLESITIHKMYTIMICGFILSLLTTIVLKILSFSFFSGFFFAFSLLSLIMLIGGVFIKRSLVRKIRQFPITFNIKKLNYLRFGKIMVMMQTRLSSLLVLAQSVFMKPIRQMRYNALYETLTWKHRLISNNVSELSSKGSWKWKKGFPDYLKPSEIMMENSDKASNMGTTLWFSESEKKEGIPIALYSCGQYSICMNLLEYIGKIKIDSTNITEAHKMLIECEQQLVSDWKQFLKEPNFLIK